MTQKAAEASTLAAFVRLVGRVIADRGGDPADLMRRSGIDPERLKRPGERVSRTAMKRLWILAVSETGDPTIGLATAEYFSPAASRALGLGLLASSSLREALTRLRRYHGVMTSGLQMALTESGDAIELSLIPSGDGSDLSAEAVDAFLAITARMCRMITNEAFAPEAVFLVREDPGAGQAYRDALGVMPRFGSDRDAIRVSIQDADSPLHGADPELATELDRLAERYLADIETDRMSATVRSILEELLPSGNPTLQNVARIMRRNPKLIQRRLVAEGLSYRDLQEQTRKALALRYIRDPDIPLSRIAQMLGFSDQSNFNRAFRRWIGSSPGDFRKNNTI